MSIKSISIRVQTNHETILIDKNMQINSLIGLSWGIPSGKIYIIGNPYIRETYL